VNGVLHILIGSLGLAFALLVFRADPRRWDNRAFAILIFLDATMALFRGINAASGADIADRAVMLPCAALSPLLAWWTIEFAASFPFNRPLPWRWRAPLMALTAGAVASIIALGGRIEIHGVLNFGFFMPAMLVMVALAWRNLRRHRGDRLGVRLVLAALLLRWITANALYAVLDVVAFETWATLLWIESTVVVLVSFALISYANLRSNLFTMRSAMGELAVESAFVLSGLILTAAAIDAALRLGAGWPRLERPLLVLAALVPLGVYVIASRLRPRLEASVDPRRAHRREVLDRVLGPGDEGDPQAFTTAALAALGEVSDGGVARLVRDAVAASEGELVAPVEHGGRRYGTIVVRGGILDRETAQAAGALGERLALAFEHRRLIEALEESRRLAALGSFAAAIAHDIRTPLTSVQMNVQILRGKVRLPADDMEYFDIAQGELRRLEGHVRELLDYAKPLQLHREVVQVEDLTEEAARTVEPILAERRLQLTRTHAADLPPVSVDPQRMKQVLWNLLDNAAKASPEGATIVVHTRRDGDGVAIDVVDHGAGIAPGDLARIFEPFFTTRPDGTGLGLAICQKVVKAHAGELRVRSAPAAGAIFTVRLPA
jgi:signal transduction histidine kinase